MKREPRLQFSDADLAEPKLEKPIKRVKKAEAKADKAQAKIPKKTVAVSYTHLTLPTNREV